MQNQDLQTVISLFREYYREAELGVFMPEKREFGVGTTKKIDSRHLSFNSLSDYRVFLSYVLFSLKQSTP